MKSLKFRRVKWTLISSLIALYGLASGPAFASSDVIFTGGGVIKDGSRADAKRISFSVNLFVNSEGASEGHLKFIFHNLDDIFGLDQSRFDTTDFDSINITTRYFDTTPFTFVRIEARGRLNGGDGWSVLARFTDFGTPVNNKALPPEHADALRISLFDPSGIAVYDTALDYPREQSWRTLLDGGNVTVDMRLVTDPQ
jgi:hypothetical protein